MDDRYNTKEGYIFDKKYHTYMDNADVMVRLNESNMDVESLSSQLAEAYETLEKITNCEIQQVSFQMARRTLRKAEQRALQGLRRYDD